VRRSFLILFALLPAGAPPPAPAPPAAHPREEEPLPCETLATAEGARWKMIHLRLAERLDESRLLAIRARLLQSEPGPWDRFTCRFYLPGTDLADGPWADANDLGVWAIEPPAPPIGTVVIDGVAMTIRRCICHVSTVGGVMHVIHDCGVECLEYGPSSCRCFGDRPATCAGGWIRHGG